MSSYNQHLGHTNARLIADDSDDDSLLDSSYSPEDISGSDSDDESMFTGASDDEMQEDEYAEDEVMEGASTSGSQRSRVSTVYPDDSMSQRGVNPSYAAYVARGVNGRSLHSVTEEGQDTENLYASNRAQKRAQRRFRHQQLKKIHGRDFTNHSKEYMLPADDSELARLDIQHNLLKIHLGALYPWQERVEWVLRPGQGVRPGILDVGTGSGRWALDMAEIFPHADVLGVDLVPPKHLPTELPPNCRFEVDDVTLPMAHHANSFDVVHVRSVDAGISDYDGLLYQIAHAMRAGGVVILITGLPQIYDADLRPFQVKEPGEEGFSWVQKTLYGAYDAYHKRGNYGVDSALHWVKWLEDNPNYENVKSNDTYIPLGAWENGLGKIERWVAESLRIDIMHVLHAFKPLLREAGHSQHDVDTMVEEGVEELRDLKIHGKLMWRYTTATRTHAPWQERRKAPTPVGEGSETLIVKPSLQKAK